MTPINLEKGGSAVVLIGVTGFVKEYANHPQIKFIECLKIPGSELEAIVPANTLAAILTEGIPKYHQTWITTFCNRRNIPYLIRKSNQAIYDTIKSFFPSKNELSKPSIEEVKETEVRGKLSVLTDLINWNESNAQNARRLIKICNERNIRTTESSLAQWMTAQRKKFSGTGLIKSARSKLDISVDMLDEAIKGLTDIRDYLIAITEENRLLKDKVEKFRKIMEN